MSIAAPPLPTPTAQARPAQPPARRIARIAGWWWVLTFVTSIPALLLYDPLLNDANYILTSGADTRIQLGAFLEVLLAISGIATAVVMYPVLKRQSQSISLGYVACRTVESTIILVGVVSVLSVLTLRDDLAPGAAALGTVGRSLVAIHDATFLLGPAFCAGFGNGLLVGYLMYRSGLVPRRMALLGLIGGPIAFATATAVLFGAWEQTSATNFLFTVPEILWEASLGVYLIVKGFRPSASVFGDAGRDATPAPATG